MENKKIRRENLLTLLSQFKTVKEFSDHVNMDASHVSQLKNSHGKIGDSIARKLEKAFNKPSGWMDTPHSISENNGIYLASDNAQPPRSAEKWAGNLEGLPPPSLLRIINIISTGIGMDDFEKHSEAARLRILRAVQTAVMDAEIKELSDKAIIKMVELNDGTESSTKPENEQNDDS